MSLAIKPIVSLRLSVLANELDVLESKAAAEGALRSGGRLRIMGRILRSSIDVLSTDLLDRLSTNDPEHSALSGADFDLCQQALKQHVSELKRIFWDRGKGIELTNRLFEAAFDEDDANDRLVIASNKIEIRKAEFQSRTSFWKWALGDARKRIWTTLLLFLGAFVLKGIEFLKLSIMG